MDLLPSVFIVEVRFCLDHKLAHWDWDNSSNNWLLLLKVRVRMRCKIVRKVVQGREEEGPAAGDIKVLDEEEGAEEVHIVEEIEILLARLQDKRQRKEVLVWMV